jgi:hypothetical protein
MPFGRWWVLVVAVAGLAAAGCADARTDAVASVASSFSAALTRGDLAGACTLLAPATRARLEAARSCREALTQDRIRGAAVVSSQVWGDRAQVQTAADTLFLNETAEGWKVAAAGCQPRTDAPYVCQLEGP